MGLARLALRDGEVERISTLFERARQLASGLNPAQAHLTLEQGRWLVEMDSSQALGQLELAARQFEVLELEAGAAESRLALRLLQGPPNLEGILPVLLRPEYRAELTHASEWLLPLALEKKAVPVDTLRAWVSRSSPGSGAALESSSVKWPSLTCSVSLKTPRWACPKSCLVHPRTTRTRASALRPRDSPPARVVPPSAGNSLAGIPSTHSPIASVSIL